VEQLVRPPPFGDVVADRHDLPGRELVHEIVPPRGGCAVVCVDTGREVFGPAGSPDLAQDVQQAELSDAGEGLGYTATDDL
jgi:hypothetical protein